MAYKNLNEFIKTLEDRNQLKRIKTTVDPKLEVTEITDRVSKSGGPALVFENVVGSDYPIAINLMGSFERMALALGLNELEDLGKKIEGLLDLKKYKTLFGKISAIPELLPIAFIFPKKVKKTRGTSVQTERDGCLVCHK